MLIEQFIETDDHFILHLEDITVLLKRRPGDTSYLRNEHVIATNNTTMNNKAFTVSSITYRWDSLTHLW